MNEYLVPEWMRLGSAVMRVTLDLAHRPAAEPRLQRICVER